MKRRRDSVLLLVVLCGIGAASPALAYDAATEFSAAIEVVEIDKQGTRHVLVAHEMTVRKNQAGLAEVAIEGGRTLNIKVTAVPDTRPSEFKTELRLRKNGQVVLAGPTVQSLSGRKATLSIGQNGSRIDIHVIVSKLDLL